MNFPKRSAMNIVHDIGDVIGEQINMMDENGIIIASTDPARMNTFHEGAKKIVAEGLDELIVRYDGEFDGARQGLNLPITFKNKTVGVIGVTGPYEQVCKFGQIIRKMTEILILNIDFTERLAVENRAKNRFLTEWMHSSPADFPALAETGRGFEIDISVPRRVMLASVIPLTNEPATQMQMTIERAEQRIIELRRHIKDNVVFKSEDRIVLLLPAAPDSEMLREAIMLKKEAESFSQVVMAVGIDSEFKGPQNIASAFVRAERALRTCLRSPSKLPRLYDSLNMEIFLAEIPDAVKAEYIRRIFRNCAPKEISGYIALLDLYYDCEGSVAEASKRLFIHKNTLEYRLRRIASATGYDPRSIKFSSLFYIAIHFYRDVFNILQ